MWSDDNSSIGSSTANNNLEVACRLAFTFTVAKLIFSSEKRFPRSLLLCFFRILPVPCNYSANGSFDEGGNELE